MVVYSLSPCQLRKKQINATEAHSAPCQPEPELFSHTALLCDRTPQEHSLTEINKVATLLSPCHCSGWLLQEFLKRCSHRKSKPECVLCLVRGARLMTKRAEHGSETATTNFGRKAFSSKTPKCWVREGQLLTNLSSLEKNKEYKLINKCTCHRFGRISQTCLSSAHSRRED